MNEKNIEHGKIVGIALLFTVMLLLSPLSASATATGTRQDGDLILRVAMQDDIKGLNPITVSDVWSWNVLRYVYDGPLGSDPETEEMIPYVAIGSANTTGDLPPAGAADFEGYCDMGVFGFTPEDTWDPRGRQIGEAIIFYDFEDVKWHDGTQMGIRDVMFSMHMAAQVPEWSASMNPLKNLGGGDGTNYTQSAFLHVHKVWENAEGNQAALKFELQEPYADFFRYTLSTFLLPYHIWGSTISGQNVDEAKIWTDPGFDLEADDAWDPGVASAFDNNPPIGNGPFKFDRWDRGSFIKIDTFRDHFFTDGYKYSEYAVNQYGESLARQPNIDAVTYRIYKTAEAAVLALKNNDVDYIAWSVPPSFVQELSNAPGIDMEQSPEPGFFYLSYNMRKPSFGYDDAGDDVAKPLRKAISHCIDKDTIITRLLLNLGLAAQGPVSPISEWFNNSVPTYAFNPSEAKNILAAADYKVRQAGTGTLLEGQAAIDAAGVDNWWMNPDGTNIGSGPGGRIDILTPEANYDPIRAQVGLMIARQLREVGIYAESMAMDFGSIVDRIDQRNFDMYILGWSIGSDPTDFLWAFFHSGNAEVGQNYPGYNNATFDTIIDEARRTGDQDARARYVAEAQAAVCYDLPYEVLYFRTNIEAYRSDRFTGWVVGRAGSIYNWNSLYSIRAPSPYRTTAQFVSPPSAIVSNTSVPISILVRDQDGSPLQGANVYLNASIGSLSIEEGPTGSNGRFDVMYNAPYADPTDPDIVANGTLATITLLRAEYTSPDGVEYDSTPGRFATIRVFPEGAEFLSVSISADPDVIDPDVAEDGTPGFTFVETVVTDQNGDPVSGASVALFVSPEVPTISPETQTTDASGQVTFTVTSTDLPDDDDSIAEFVLTVIAIHPTNPNIQGENQFHLSIRDRHYETETETPFPSVLVVVSMMLVASVSYAAIRKKRVQ